MIERGGHHLDLMISHDDDPHEVRLARDFEMARVREWCAVFRAAVPARSWGDRLKAPALP